MQIHPTRSAIDLAVVGGVLLTTGLALQDAAVFGYGSALFLGLGIARALTSVLIISARRAGLEMIWGQKEKSFRAVRDEKFEFHAELCNRSVWPIRFRSLRPVCSAELEVSVSPQEATIFPGNQLSVQLSVVPKRVGTQGIHGLSFEVLGVPGLFEVPLTFANPIVVDVLPKSSGAWLRNARGGRSRHNADAGNPGLVFGEGDNLRELREHRSGDPFRRIAWKASARRGSLMVREYERDEQGVAWLVLDASGDLWAGKPGSAPLDQMIDEVSGTLLKLLERRFKVGLVIVASGRCLAWFEPGQGVAHATQLLSALAYQTGTRDYDRSGYDEADVALRVLEHLRPLDALHSARLRTNELDRIARRASQWLLRAPSTPREVRGRSEREGILRTYLAAFGIPCPPKMESDRLGTDYELARTLQTISRKRPRPTWICVWAPAADLSQRSALRQVLQNYPRRHSRLIWVSVPVEAVPRSSIDPNTFAAEHALRVRSQIAREKAERELHALGVEVSRPGGPSAFIARRKAI